jgi:hypothetical protein
MTKYADIRHESQLVAIAESKEKAEKIRQEEEEWIKNKCPAFEAECGKTGWACELKAKKVGRNVLDNGIIVKACATCK